VTADRIPAQAVGDSPKYRADYQAKTHRAGIITGTIAPFRWFSPERPPLHSFAHAIQSWRNDCHHPCQRLPVLRMREVSLAPRVQARKSSPVMLLRTAF